MEVKKYYDFDKGRLVTDDEPKPVGRAIVQFAQKIVEQKRFSSETEVEILRQYRLIKSKRSALSTKKRKQIVAYVEHFKLNKDD